MPLEGVGGCGHQEGIWFELLLFFYRIERCWAERFAASEPVAAEVGIVVRVPTALAHRCFVLVPAAVAVEAHMALKVEAQTGIVRFVAVAALEVVIMVLVVQDFVSQELVHTGLVGGHLMEACYKVMVLGE